MIRMVRHASMCTDLKHLQDEAEELRWSILPAISAANAFKLYSLFNEALSRQCETTLLPVRRLIDLLSHNVLNQILTNQMTEGCRNHHLKGSPT